MTDTAVEPNISVEEKVPGIVFIIKALQVSHESESNLDVSGCCSSSSCSLAQYCVSSNTFKCIYKRKMSMLLNFIFCCLDELLPYKNKHAWFGFLMHILPSFENSEAPGKCSFRTV